MKGLSLSQVDPRPVWLGWCGGCGANLCSEVGLESEVAAAIEQWKLRGLRVSQCDPGLRVEIDRCLCVPRI